MNYKLSDYLMTLFSLSDSYIDEDSTDEEDNSESLESEVY